MKAKISFLIGLSFLMLINTNAQWGNFGPLGSESTRLIDPPGPLFGQMLSAGVGIYNLPFPNGYPLASTPARLHVSDLTLPLPVNGSFLFGDLFRTDGIQGVVNSWSMWTGVNVNALTEKFNLSTQGAAGNLQINTVQPTGSIFLRPNNFNTLQASPTGGTGTYGTLPNRGQIFIRNFAPVDLNAMLMIGGPLKFSEGLAGGAATQFYGYTNVVGIPNGDGYRVKYDNNAGPPVADCLIFEKPMLKLQILMAVLNLLIPEMMALKN